ncbi:ribokinase [Gordonia rhizosphera]|uniref:Ribokinase n=1 Tax=Gordonia rhizosphera NBRC 16068 TaxID=1108045 RepID=K6V8R1_9ACTN|nr:ribokinase [Gordonia rhizosphera]GAB92618.1 ribokinase [Gordonia rhizosphera NBRC 16068]
MEPNTSSIDVAVVGTLNMDVVVRVTRMPDVGETVLGRSLSERPGGKGANQALAAATITPSTLIGAVGDDEAGDRLLAVQRSGGVDIAHIGRVEGISGRAVIEVDDAADNRIIVLSGANAALDAADVTRGLDVVGPGVVLTQLESPGPVTAAAADWAARHRRRFILNPSPVAALDESILAAADPLVVNEHEAAFYAGGEASDDPAELARALGGLARSAVLTLGGRGVIVAVDDELTQIAVARVRPVDTTGAGDVFVGTLAGHLARGLTLVDAAEKSAVAATDFVARARE